MPEAEEFDLKSFQDKVLENISVLNCLVELKRGFGFDDIKPRSEGLRASVVFQIFKSFIGVAELLAGPPEETIRAIKKDKKIDESAEQARGFLKRQETRQLLCPTLQSTENNLSKLALRDFEGDVKEIACAITRVLAPLAQANAITLPLDPMHFALSAWMIARTGVTKYCAGQDRAAKEAHDY